MQNGTEKLWLFWQIKCTFPIKKEKLLQLQFNHLPHPLLMVEAEGFYSSSFVIKPITFLLQCTSAKGKKVAFEGKYFPQSAVGGGCHSQPAAKVVELA